MSESLFDPDEYAPKPKPWQRPIDVARLEGIAKVRSNTPPAWTAAFDAEFGRLASLGEPFSVKDIVTVVGKPEDVHPSAISARMRVNVNRGTVERVGVVWRPTHGDWINQWQGRASA